jgi:hypothetical protein
MFGGLLGIGLSDDCEGEGGKKGEVQSRTA